MVTEERDDTMEIGKEERKEEEEKGGTVGDEDKGKKKRGRKPKDAEEKKVSTAERPTRERKTVERFSAMSPQSVSATKTLSIKQVSLLLDVVHGEHNQWKDLGLLRFNYSIFSLGL